MQIGRQFLGRCGTAPSIEPPLRPVGPERRPEPRQTRQPDRHDTQTPPACHGSLFRSLPRRYYYYNATWAFARWVSRPTARRSRVGAVENAVFAAGRETRRAKWRCSAIIPAQAGLATANPCIGARHVVRTPTFPAKQGRNPPIPVATPYGVARAAVARTRRSSSSGALDARHRMNLTAAMAGASTGQASGWPPRRRGTLPCRGPSGVCGRGASRCR